MHTRFGVFVLRWLSSVVCLLVLLPSSAVAADGGGTQVTISSQVAGVRLVLIDEHQRIVQIQSNTTDSVSPTFYKTSFDSVPITASKQLLQQYYRLIQQLNTQNSGVIYRYQPPRPPILQLITGFTAQMRPTMLWQPEAHSAAFLFN